MSNLSFPEDTPCKKNVGLFSSSLLEGFDSEEFRESHPELDEDRMIEELAIAESTHKLLSKEAVKEAIALCRSCPVLDKCFELYITTETPQTRVYGVVGGMTAKQRRKERVKRGLI